MAAWVRSTGFRSQKFVVSGDYGSGSPLFRKCMKHAFETEWSSEFWERNREQLFEKYGRLVKTTLNHKRNCCQTSIRNKLRELLRDKKIPENYLEKLIKGPRVEEGVDVNSNPYAIAMTQFLKTVTSEQIYRENIAKEPIPEWVSAGDEAMVLLLVENCWEQVREIVVNRKMSPDEFAKENKKCRDLNMDELDEKNMACSSKYSSGGKGCREQQGWRPEGIQRFNELRISVEMVRKTREGKKFYDCLWKREKQIAEAKNRKRQKENDEAITKEDCDWSDDEDSDVASNRSEVRVQRPRIDANPNRTIERDGRKFLLTAFGDEVEIDMDEV